MAPADRDRLLDVVARARHDHAERLDLVDAGVGRVERARDRVEADLALEGGFEIASQGVDVHARRIMIPAFARRLSAALRASTAATETRASTATT